MASGLSNKLAGQIGEFLVCAELGRRGLIATPFSGNVPGFDVVVCNDALQSLPIQVKTSRGTTWPTKADLWLNIEIDPATETQINRGRRKIDNPDLIYVCVALGTKRTSEALGAKRTSDRFFICQKSDIQDIAIQRYTAWMQPKGWKRPRNYRSLDNRYGTHDLIQHEDKWQLIETRLRELTNRVPRAAPTATSTSE